MTLIDAALRTGKYRAVYGYIAPYLKQSKAIAWSYILHYARKIPGVKVNESELWVELPNGARIRLFGADNADAMRGMYFDGVVLDEVADMRPEVWGEVVRPALADRRGWALFIGTPKGINLFSELYYSAMQDEAWYAGCWTVADTGVLPDDELALARRSMSDNQYRQEFLCDFSASSDNQLITIDQVIEATGKHLENSAYTGSARILGVDVARYGDDRSVIFPRQGLVAMPPIVLNNIDNMELASRVAHKSDQWQADAIFVDAGRGEGVIDRLNQLGYSPIPVDFGGRANDDHFENKRAEMWSSLAEWIKSGGCLPDLPELKADLCAPTFSYANKRGRFALETKDQMRDRGLRSPDIADALALTFAHPVALRGGPGAAKLRQPQFARRDYDPF